MQTLIMQFKILKAASAAVLLAVSCVSARADVGFSINAADLRGGVGGNAPMPVGGLVLFVASTGDGEFAAPRADYFVLPGGDDIVLMAFEMQIDDVFSGALANVPLGVNGLTTGDLLQLYWYPTLTLETYDGGLGSPGEVRYGTYTDSVGVDGSEIWAVPSDNVSAYNLLFFTLSSGGGTRDNDLGYADYIVAPVPEASNVIFGGLALGVVAIRLLPQIRLKLQKN